MTSDVWHHKLIIPSKRDNPAESMFTDSVSLAQAAPASGDVPEHVTASATFLGLVSLSSHIPGCCRAGATSTINHNHAK